MRPADIWPAQEQIELSVSRRHAASRTEKGVCRGKAATSADNRDAPVRGPSARLARARSTIALLVPAGPAAGNHNPTGQQCLRSGRRFPIVIPQQSTQPLPAWNLTTGTPDFLAWHENPNAHSMVIAFCVVMFEELDDRLPQQHLPKNIILSRHSFLSVEKRGATGLIRLCSHR